MTQQLWIRCLLLLGLGAFVPLFYYLAVVGGFLPYFGMLIIAARHPTDPDMLLFSFVHLSLYGALLYWISGVMARMLGRLAGVQVWAATAATLLLLAGIGLLPVFGIAHGHIKWLSAYALYASGNLR